MASPIASCWPIRSQHYRLSLEFRIASASPGQALPSHFPNRANGDIHLEMQAKAAIMQEMARGLFGVVIRGQRRKESEGFVTNEAGYEQADSVTGLVHRN